MDRDGLFELKRKWLPLFVLGAAVFGAGLALGVLWAYRESPRWFTDAVVELLTPASPGPPPRGTLISAAAAVLAIVGGAAALYAARRINRSEVGEIDSFWWKVAVGALAGQWWLREPRIAVLAAGSHQVGLLRALKTISGRLTVLGQASPELVMALAAPEDETAVRRVLTLVNGRGHSAHELADGLRLRGRFLPLAPTLPALDAIAQADVLVLAPDLDAEENFGLGADDRIAAAVKKMRGRKIVVGSVSAAQHGVLEAAVEWIGRQFGTPHKILVNNNTAQPLPPGRTYQRVRGAVERDILDWAAPEQWDADKLAVFLREAMNRP